MPADAPPAVQEPGNSGTYLTPDVPTRNPNRRSHEEIPVSPVDGTNPSHNFSYPKRSSMNNLAGENGENAPRSSGALGGLKSAAVGLHVSATKLPLRYTASSVY